MELRVGCAMWANRAWIGTSIPLGTPAGSELAAYASTLNAVEGNTTFYALPTLDVARRWADSVPSDFRFMFKLPREVTHERKLRNTSQALAAFLRATEPCHELMEPIAIQLPPTFGPESLDVLTAFIDSLPQTLHWAVEVRDPTFFVDVDHERRLNDELFTRRVDRIILDTRGVFAGPCVTESEKEAFANKPRLPVRAVATGELPVVRFIGQTDAAENANYWEPWIDTVVRWLDDGRTPTMFMHTPDNKSAPALCRQFHDAVRSRLPELEPLPDLPPVDAPTLFE